MRFVGYRVRLEVSGGHTAISGDFIPPAGFVWDAGFGMPLSRVTGLKVEPLYEPETCEICGVTEGHEEYCVWARMLA